MKKGKRKKKQVKMKKIRKEYRIENGKIFK